VVCQFKEPSATLPTAPYLATADRGVFSERNEQFARDLGVKQVALPKPGTQNCRYKRREAQPWFKAAMRFRAGIEGRISGLKRARQLDRCRNRGQNDLERWVGWVSSTTTWSS
jgi:transposase, IS5 family